ncbi:MAG: antitermination protein NusG [Pirellulales bacterium]|nr:antitermination protein NusG [Pirellulales bacterium]
MPILPKEPNVYPDCLFQSGVPADREDRRWWVLHTKPRQEKSLARQLHAGHVPFYLPLIPHTTYSRGRKLTSHLPLFAGYTFLYADQDERVTALGTNRITQTLEVKDQSRFWADVKQIEQLITSGAPITPHDKLGPGDAVIIRSGPLAGLEGTILRTATGNRFVVRIDFIQKGASVLIDDYHLDIPI